jgi:hypothetical protein
MDLGPETLDWAKAFPDLAERYVRSNDDRFEKVVREILLE